MNRDRILSMLCELCAMPSVTESRGEVEAAQGIADMLLRMDYFKAHPENVVVHDIEGDARGRRFTTALMRGGKKSAKTVILYGHFDVVGVSEFGALQSAAFDPMRYTELLRQGSIVLDPDAQRDLDSGDWLFGRGVCDMKFGLATCMEVLYQAEQDLANFEGNLLLLAVCDEEGNSTGMLGSLPYLKKLRDEEGLVYQGVIVTEPYMTHEGDGEKIRRLHVASVGKLLPLFYCVGRSGHTLDPYGCLSPNLLTSKIVEKLEQNPAFCDSAGEFFSPAPLCLKQSDTKDSYTVQIPVSAYAYFNLMTYRRNPDAVLGEMLDIARDSFREVLDGLAQRRSDFEKLSGLSMADKPAFQPKVLTWGELYNLCLSAHGDSFKQHMDAFIAGSTERDFRALTVQVIAEAHKFCPDRDPMIIVCFAPPYYPNSPQLAENSRIERLCAHLAEVGAERYGEHFVIDYTFDGISDMSYMNIDPAVRPGDLETSFPLWGNRYSIPIDLIRDLSLPMVNVGCRGKDLHRHTERAQLSYTLGVAAPMTWEAMQWLLRD